VVTPGTPGDAYTLLRLAIESPDPVVFLEPKRRYWAREATVLDHTGRPWTAPSSGGRART